MSILGITPDLTTYASTTRTLIDKWGAVADSITENWEVIKDDLGEVVDAHPYWDVVFKDGSELSVEPMGTLKAPEPGVYDCKASSVKDTQALINKFISVLDKEVKVDYLVAYSPYQEVAAVLPRRTFKFKSGESIVESLRGVAV